ncbi:hypothetical protein AEQ27_08285 [Frigoribacterium sp. RIT-PI-h]|nr:hypothetical protein AEQ27_08285 [Frigoribacterium sp. RIT-PI-h]
MVVDHLGDDEVQEGLGEGRVETGLFGQATQALDLHALTLGVARRHAGRRLEQADGLRVLEPLGEHVDEGGVDVVDALADARELVDRALVG